MWPGWVSDDDTLSRSRERGRAILRAAAAGQRRLQPLARSSRHRFQPIAVEGQATGVSTRPGPSSG